MTITADKRKIKARRVPEADARLARDLERLRETQIAVAQELAQVDACAHFVFSGCASIVEYATKLGFSATEARTFTNLGKTLAAAPEAEARVRSGEISVEAAAAVGRILACPQLIRDGDDWLAAAAAEPLRSLRRRIRQRLELQASGEPGVEEVSVYVPARTKDAFARARHVASEKAGRALTDGQTFTRVVDFYLEKNDPERKAGRKRRLGDTSTRPASRYVPAEVRRAIRRRSGGTCEVPGCEHRLGLEFAHRTPHRLGSGREARDLAALCRRHHVLYDAGRIPWPLEDAPVRTHEGDRDRVRERAPPWGAGRYARSLSPW